MLKVNNSISTFQLNKWYTLCFVVLSLGTNLSAQVIYGNTADSKVYKYNVSDCTNELLVDLPLIVNCTDIAFHPLGNLYGISNLGQLFRIDTLDGSLTLVHDFPFDFDLFFPEYTSLTFDANGVAYASGIGEEILTYEIATGIETNLGNTGFVAAGDLVFNDGALYMTTINNEIVKVDLDNPSNSSVIINVSQDNLYGLVSVRDDCGELETFLIANNVSNPNGISPKILRVNFESNSLTLACDTELDFFGSTSPTEYLGSISDLIFEVSGSIIGNTICDEDNGFFSVDVYGGFGEVMYSLDGVNFQNSSSFDSLPAGTYTVYIQDETGCVFTEDIIVENSDALEVQSFESTPSFCGANNGVIEVFVNDENALFSIEGSEYSVENIFDSLMPGMYNIQIQNDLGCETAIDVSVLENTEDCQIEVPNAFTPNGDGSSDLFNLSAYVGFEGSISLKVFNRWGEVVYSNSNLDSTQGGWDGTKDGKAMPSDVYLYIFEVEDFIKNISQTYTGDLTLLR